MSKKQTPKIVANKIHLFSINVFMAHLETSDKFLDNPKEIEGFDLGLAKNVAFNTEDKRIRFRLFFTLKGMDENRQPIGIEAEYGIEFHFKIDNFEEFVHTDDNDGHQIEATFAGTLMGIAYSTARGIILERIQGTFFDAVILPVIDPMKAVMDDDKN